MAENDEHSKSVPGPTDEPEDDISALLEAGYDLMDGFARWLEESAGVNARISEQDCFNVECLLDYLANYGRKQLAHINEFELRWFVFSHYVRKAHAESETKDRLLDSLSRLFVFMADERGYQIPEWVEHVLSDREYYTQRVREYEALDVEDEGAWVAGFDAWSRDLESDLDLRCLWLPEDLGAGVRWGELMGLRESALRHEANLLWQEQRDELLRQGVDFDTMRDRLMSAYENWVNTPDCRLEGQTPREAVLTEREQIEDGVRESGDSDADEP